MLEVLTSEVSYITLSSFRLLQLENEDIKILRKVGKYLPTERE